MKGLLKTAFQSQQNFRLLVVIILAMCAATIASQAELFAMGLITQKGPDFFELFSGKSSGPVSFADVEAAWVNIVPTLSTPITLDDASNFMIKERSGDFLVRAFNYVNETFQVKKNLGNLAIFLVLIALFKATTLFIHRYSTKLAAIRISSDLRQRYFEHIQTLPMSFYQRHNMGSLSSRAVGDAALVAEALNACLVNYIQTPFTVLTTLTLCFLTSWELTLFVFFGFPLIVFPILFLSKGVKRIAKHIQGTQEKFASVLLDFIGGIQTVKIFGMEPFSLEKYKEHNRQMASLEKRGAKYDLASRPIVHTIAMGFLSISLVYGLFVLHMQVAEVLFYCGMLYLFYEPIKKFAEENSQIQRGVAAAERMMEVMALKPEIKDEEGALQLSSFQDEIAFHDVWFKYGEEWVLRGLSFTVKKGQKVALVGSTGAGKSTIVQLIPRLYDVQKGSITIDGKPLSSYTQSSIRDIIAFVPQRPFLFIDTIRANISYGKDFSLDAVKSAAKRAHASEFIEKLPEQYETQVLEGGKNFSGGQQQRLAIARALVKDAPILIMDEATSALDAVSEDLIKKALHGLKGEKTQILIAHRLSTVEDADKIIFIDKGVKVDEGTQAELLDRCPAFRKMWELLNQSSIG